jgi:drug/metabolite transporter (DMT)-like permease
VSSIAWRRRAPPFFLSIQPLLGALLGVWWLGEPLTAFMVAGGALILVGSTWPSARDGVRVRGMG